MLEENDALDGISETFVLPTNNEEDYKKAVILLKIPYFPLELEQSYNMSSVFYESQYYQDIYPFLRVRRRMRLYFKLLSYFSFKIIATRFFRNLSSILLILNTFLIMLQIFPINTQRIFNALFYLECLLKLSAYGFFEKETGYFRSGYNIIDFICNVGFVLHSMLSHEYLNYMDISPLRTLRLLSIIPSIKLQHILQSLISSFLLLTEIIILLASFLLFYSLIGLHLFYGLLKNRCLNPMTGLPTLSNSFCGNIACESGSICGKVAFNPDLDITSFDNIFYSFLQVFRFFTLSDWTTPMYLLQRTYSNFAWIYPLSLVFVGNYFLLNLMFAVLKVKFAENQNKYNDNQTVTTVKLNGGVRYDFKQMVKEHMYHSKRTPSNRIMTTLNSKIYPKNSKKSFGSKLPLYLNTSLRTIETLKSTSFFEPFVKYFQKIKENIRKFSKQRLTSLQSSYGNKTSYLEIRVKHEMHYKSSSENDVLHTKKNIIANGKKKSQRRNLDFTKELENIKRRWEHDRFKFPITDLKHTLNSKVIVTKKTLPLMLTKGLLTRKSTKITVDRLPQPQQKIFKGRKGYIIFKIFD